MIDGSPTVNRVLADLSDIPGTGKNSYNGVEIVDNNNLRTSNPGQKDRDTKACLNPPPP